MKNNTEQIGGYLQNEMSAEERAAFEKQLAYDKELQEEFSIQKQMINVVKTQGLKNSFGKAIRTKFISRMLIRWGIVAIVVSGLVFYALKTNMFSHMAEDRKINVVEGTESFVINNSSDTIIETEEGVVFGIPANAFGNNNKKVRLEIKTAISPEKIMLQGLSTTSNGQLLQTAGMFYINGYVNEKPVSLVKKIDVSVPTKNVNPAMQLFNGVHDSSGRINWVNPKPIEKGLRTYDITSLDFYPPDYIPVLKALGNNYTNKKYTDSLYYSFSGYGDAGIPTFSNITKDSNGVIVINRKWKDEANRDRVKTNASKKTPSDRVVREDEAVVTDTSKKIPSDSLVRKDLSDHFPFHEIDPSRIRAIWDKKFNNTIIATKEFEERLQYIHGTCSPLFLVYLENLNKPMYQIDQFIADNAEEMYEVQHKFLEFAARKDGGVMLKEGMQEKLSAYFEKKFEAYREASEKTWAKREGELTRLAAIADDKRREQETRDFIREDKNFNQEFCLNLTDAYKQIGIKRTCNDTIPPPPPATKYYNTTIDTVGWKNLDVYVFDATVNRESMKYTDPTTGKVATLTYKELSITIEDQSQYENVFVYLLPDSLKSFQRIEQDGNVFKGKLNMLFKYDLVAIAYKDDKIFFYRQSAIEPGQYTFRLSSITEKELKKILNTYSKEKSRDMLNEHEYQLFEQQEIKREVQLRKDLDFRNQGMRAIWNCNREIVSEVQPKDMGSGPK